MNLNTALISPISPFRRRPFRGIISRENTAGTTRLTPSAKGIIPFANLIMGLNLKQKVLLGWQRLTPPWASHRFLVSSKSVRELSDEIAQQKQPYAGLTGVLM